MAVRKRENGSLTGSKRYAAEKGLDTPESIQETDALARASVKAKMSDAVGARAKKLAESLGSELQPNEVLSKVANAVTSVASNISQTGNDIKQGIQAIQGYQGYTQGYASNNLVATQDPYGGVAMPLMDFKDLVPQDLLNPSINIKATEEQLTNGLAEYAAGTRAQVLLQAGFKYIEEVGKTKQQYHKAEQSLIKASTEGVKVHQEIVKFDTQKVELAINYEKLEQTDERLKQAQITTLAGKNETQQLVQKFEAMESKREATINQIKAQTADIVQRYLKDSINQAS